MPILVNIALVGWVPIVIALFHFLPPRRAALIGFIGGTLFLPMAAMKFPDVPDYTKYGACSIAVLGGVLLFDRRTLAKLRFHPLDIPMIIFCLSPFATALSAGRGPLAGLSFVTTKILEWGIPYLIGRAYLCDPKGLRHLAYAVFIGGLVYLPFIWYEMRVSPQLHRMVYGFHQAGFAHAVRYGGWRPRVFMQMGLMVAFWMAAITTVAFWLWRTKTLTRVGKVPMAVVVPVLMATTVLCRSGNGVVVMVLGIGTYYATRLLKSPIPLLMVALIAPSYIALRATDSWDGSEVVSLFSFSPDRSGGLSGRMRQEDVYTDRAWERPLWGWGDGDFIPRDEMGKKIVRGNDSFWIITLGLYGLASLVSIFLCFLLPALILVRRIPVRQWLAPPASPIAVMTLVIAMYAMDCLFNAMFNPVYVLAVGGICGLAARGYVPQASAGATFGIHHGSHVRSVPTQLTRTTPRESTHGAG